MTQQSRYWAYTQKKAIIKMREPQCSLSSTIHNSQDMKASRCPSAETLGKEAVLPNHSGDHSGHFLCVRQFVMNYH